MTRQGPARRWLSLPGLVIAVVSASCALTFTDYELDQGTSSASASGGAGGAATTLTPDGAPCGADEECLNANCLASNTGEGRICCAFDCPDMGPGSCATNGKCDAQGESCALYPTGTVCSEMAACVDGMLTSMQCQLGSCEQILSRCPAGFTCEDEDACKTTCTTIMDCIHPDALCVGGKCIHPVGAPCGSNSQCESTICGTTGVGHCCVEQCTVGDAECAAIDCDPAGACLYPTTPCGADPTCAGATLTSQYCDEMGHCGAAREDRACADHYVCDGPDACHTMCGSNDSTGDRFCDQKFWCDGSACVPAGGGGAPCNRATQCASGLCFTLFLVNRCL